MEKKERHQIKENELFVLLKKLYELIIKFKKEILYVFLVLLGIIVLFWGFLSYSNLRERHAGMLLSQALEDEINYEKLKLIGKKYKNTLSGREANLILSIKEGKPSEDLLKYIEDLLKKVKDPILKGILINNAVEIYLSNKKYDLAIKFLDKYKNDLPDDFYLFLNGKIKESSGQIEEAKAQYQRLFNEFPESNLRYQAQQRLNAL